MKKLLSLFFAISLALSACEIASTPTMIATQPPATSTPKYSLTATLLPNLSPPPTDVFPILITPHVTPFPTRTHAEASEELAHMLTTNGDCKFPCFWGIYPDATRYEELYSVIDRLGGSRFETLQENGDIRVATTFRFEERSGIFVEFQANLQDNLVKDLKVSLLNLFDPEVSSKDWAAYNLNEILRTYGVPDSVELYFSEPYPALWFFFKTKI